MTSQDGTLTDSAPGTLGFALSAPVSAFGFEVQPLTGTEGIEVTFYCGSPVGINNCSDTVPSPYDRGGEDTAGTYLFEGATTLGSAITEVHIDPFLGAIQTPYVITDIRYTLAAQSAVPEPETGGLSLFGGIIGSVIIRFRSRHKGA